MSSFFICTSRHHVENRNIEGFIYYETHYILLIIDVFHTEFTYKCLNRSQSGSAINYRHLCDDDVSSAIFECSSNHPCIHGCLKKIGFTRLISRKRARNRRDRCRYRCNELSRANITLLVTQTNSRFYPNLPILNSITKSTLEMSACHSTHV